MLPTRRLRIKGQKPKTPEPAAPEPVAPSTASAHPWYIDLTRKSHPISKPLLSGLDLAGGPDMSVYGSVDADGGKYMGNVCGMSIIVDDAVPDGEAVVMWGKTYVNSGTFAAIKLATEEKG